MQPGFEASRKKSLQNNIIKEIKKARENSQGILVLEFITNECNKTHKAIIDPLRNYPFKKIVEKKDCDGSEEIMEQLRKHSFFNKTHLKICGVNTDECVADTVNTLSEFDDIEIEVLPECCNTDHSTVGESFDAIYLHRDNVNIGWPP
jgi:GTPase Era involved in 16S rRNA processing